MSDEATDRASTSRAPGPDIEAEADMGQMPDTPSTEDADRLSATNSEVESAMNHLRRRATLHDPGFSKETFDGFSSADAYIRAARDGINKATRQHLKDVQVILLRPNAMVIYQ